MTIYIGSNSIEAGSSIGQNIADNKQVVGAGTVTNIIHTNVVLYRQYQQRDRRQETGASQYVLLRETCISESDATSHTSANNANERKNRVHVCTCCRTLVGIMVSDGSGPQPPYMHVLLEQP
jgi:hypothetical protein